MVPTLPPHEHVSLAEAKVGQMLAIDRITEEGEADRQLLKFLWDNGVRPGVGLTVTEVAPYAGTVSFRIDGHLVTIGLVAAGKIWVYDPASIPLARPARAASRSS